MILFEGRLLPNEDMDTVMEQLWDACVRGIMNREDVAERVIHAAGRVAEKIKIGTYDAILQPLLQQGTFTEAQLDEVIQFFDEDNLQLKYDIELGRFKKEVEQEERTGRRKVVEPLGILFHIAAGNAEGLPFYSVLEGMLAGNINILKLPSMDDGISVLLLHEILKEEPSLASYVCVLDVPSTNLAVMKRLADMSDGIVVWGGDEAIKAIRAYASPETQIISWGHKLSFAYVTPDVINDADSQQELYLLAHHICTTRQVLCNSCQGLFVDSDDMQVVTAVGQKFFEILQEVNQEYRPEAIGVRGKISIALYNEELESSMKQRQIFKGTGVSVIVSEDSKLELSYMFRNCWVKPLPKSRIVAELKNNRGHLQTVGLISNAKERLLLVEALSKAGVTRITKAGNMSKTISGEAHDGEYPLRRYCKIVEIEE